MATVAVVGTAVDHPDVAELTTIDVTRVPEGDADLVAVSGADPEWPELARGAVLRGALVHLLRPVALPPLGGSVLSDLLDPGPGVLVSSPVLARSAWTQMLDRTCAVDRWAFLEMTVTTPGEVAEDEVAHALRMLRHLGSDGGWRPVGGTAAVVHCRSDTSWARPAHLTVHRGPAAPSWELLAVAEDTRLTLAGTRLHQAEELSIAWYSANGMQRPAVSYENGIRASWASSLACSRDPKEGSVYPLAAYLEDRAAAEALLDGG
jgi:hypothetical protein